LKEIKIVSPLCIDVPYKKLDKKPKRYYLNLNAYRNWHHHVNNMLKTRYKDLMKDQIEGLKLQTPISVEFTLYKGSKRKMDKGNTFTVQSKFLYDALVEYGCIEDDNDEHIYDEILRKTEYDKENPRVEFIIREVDKC
jgi:Holliday junction resolvase RusA-like endonuclease